MLQLRLVTNECSCLSTTWTCRGGQNGTWELHAWWYPVNVSHWVCMSMLPFVSRGILLLWLYFDDRCVPLEGNPQSSHDKMCCCWPFFRCPRRKDTFGSQPPLELLRQWIDYGCWYDRQKQTLRPWGTVLGPHLSSDETPAAAVSIGFPVPFVRLKQFCPKRIPSLPLQVCRGYPHGFCYGTSWRWPCCDLFALAERQQQSLLCASFHRWNFSSLLSYLLWNLRPLQCN